MARPRIGLVLSGGGFVGGAWMAGAMNAIARASGWDPGTADYVLGTSAGAMLAALLTSAIPPWLMMEYGTLGGLPQSGMGAASSLGGDFRVHWSFPRPVLGSPSLALRSLREPWKYGPAGIIAWLPQGVVSTEPLKAVIRRIVRHGWVIHPHLWIAAIDYENGERIAFGREDAPGAELADAVAASCAIPGFYRPVTIGRRRYVDGGMISPANLDLMAAADVDIVICLNPMSSRYRGGLLSATGPLAALIRGDNRRRLDREAETLRSSGKRVFLVEPKAEDIKVMGFNYMSRRGLDRVAETALRTTTESLQRSELGRELRAFPRGEAARLRPPPGDPSTWPGELFPPRLESAS